MQAKKGMKYEELVVRFGASFDKVNHEATLSWSCTPDFKEEICKRLPGRCKRQINGTFMSEETIVIKFIERRKCSEQQLLGPVLKELRRIIDDQPSATMSQRRTRRNTKGYDNKPPKRQRVVVTTHS